MLSIALTLLFLLANEPLQRIDTGEVSQLRLEIAEENIQRLRKNPRVEVPATIHVGSGPANPVLVRLKGRGTFQPIDLKPSFTILARNPPYLFGTTKFHLNNSAEDPTFLKEILGTEIFRSAGVSAPLVGHAHVSLNNRSLGIYVLKEGFTTNFLTRNFGQGTGILYDTGDGHDVDQSLEIDLGEPALANKLRVALASAAKEADHALRLEKLRSLIDIDLFLKFVALEVLTCHWDGYALSQNNCRLHFGGTPARFHFLPTGMDQIFAKPDFPWNPPTSGLVAQSILETDSGRALYRQQFEQVLANSLDVAHLSNRITSFRAKLEPLLNRSEYDAFLSETTQFAAKIAQRSASLQTQVDAAHTVSPEFRNGKATLTHWQPFDEPLGGKLYSDQSGLRIIAGPKTSASWQCKIVLSPGTYALSAPVTVRKVVALPFGDRNGATLRVLGKDAKSTAIIETADSTLRCGFQLFETEELTLACELRASHGQVLFGFPITLEKLGIK